MCAEGWTPQVILAGWKGRCERNCLKAAGGGGGGLISKHHAKELRLSVPATGNRQLPVPGGVQADTAATSVRLREKYSCSRGE